MWLNPGWGWGWTKRGCTRVRWRLNDTTARAGWGCGVGGGATHLCCASCQPRGSPRPCGAWKAGSPLERRRRRSEQDGKSERGGATGQLAGARPPFAGFPAAKRQQMSSELRTTSQVHHGRERYAHEMLCMPSMLPCGAKNHRF